MSTNSTSKGWNIALWVIQVLLAVMFGFSGFMKVSTPIEEMAKQMAWVSDMPGLVRFIGVTEILGALGLILPWALNIQRKLTPIAAFGLLTIMVFAIVFHISRSEFSALGFNVILGGLAATVGLKRWKEAKA